MHWSEHGSTFHLSIGGTADLEGPELGVCLARMMDVAQTSKVVLRVTFLHHRLSTDGLRVALDFMRAIGPGLAAVAVVTDSLKVRVTCSWVALAMVPLLPGARLEVFDEEPAASAWLADVLRSGHVPAH